MNWKKVSFAAVLLAALMVTVFTACKAPDTDSKVIEQVDSIDKGYKIYRIKKDSYELDYEEHQFQSLTSMDLIDECLNALCEVQVGKRYQNLLTDGAEIVDFGYDEEEKQADIYFNEAYDQMSSSHEVLCRAAIVQTLTQFGGVIDYVQFFINGEAMKGSDGRDMIMMASDFVDSTSADLKDLNEDTLILYFSSTDGLHLVEEDVHVRYYSSSQVERVVMESLLSGPFTEGHLQTMPADTKLNAISVEDGLCTVDLNQRFLGVIENQSLSVKVYSVVNSLCELDSVDRVRILIDGQVSDISDDTLSLKEPLEANGEVILKSVDIPVLETVDDESVETEEESE